MCPSSVCQDHPTAPGSWSWDGSAPHFTNTKAKQEGVCLCLLEPELPFLPCRSHGWLLQQAADGVWHRDSHRPPELRHRARAGEEIQLKPAAAWSLLSILQPQTKNQGHDLSTILFFPPFFGVFSFLILKISSQPSCCQLPSQCVLLHCPASVTLFLNQAKQYFLSRQFIFLLIYIYIYICMCKK